MRGPRRGRARPRSRRQRRGAAFLHPQVAAMTATIFRQALLAIGEAGVSWGGLRPRSRTPAATAAGEVAAGEVVTGEVVTAETATPTQPGGLPQPPRQESATATVESVNDVNVTQSSPPADSTRGAETDQLELMFEEDLALEATEEDNRSLQEVSDDLDRLLEEGSRGWAL